MTSSGLKKMTILTNASPRIKAKVLLPISEGMLIAVLKFPLPVIGSETQPVLTIMEALLLPVLPMRLQFQEGAPHMIGLMEPFFMPITMMVTLIIALPNLMALLKAFLLMHLLFVVKMKTLGPAILTQALPIPVVTLMFPQCVVLERLHLEEVAKLTQMFLGASPMLC